MSLSELILAMLPNYPPSSIRDVIFYLIFIPFLIRIYYLWKLDQRFKKMIPTDRMKAVKLIHQLEIPRLRAFWNQQLLTIFLPILITLPVLYYFGLHEMTWDDLPSDVASLGALVLAFWLLIDFQIALAMNKTLHKLLDLIESLMGRMINQLPENFQSYGEGFSMELLNHAVKLRRKMKEANLFVSQNELRLSEENFFPILGRIGEEISDFIRDLIHTPAQMVKENLQELLKKSTEDIDKKLNTFIPEDIVSRKKMLWNIFWAAFPSLWLAFLVEYNGL